MAGANAVEEAWAKMSARLTALREANAKREQRHRDDHLWFMFCALWWCVGFHEAMRHDLFKVDDIARKLELMLQAQTAICLRIMQAEFCIAEVA